MYRYNIIVTGMFKKYVYPLLFYTPEGGKLV